MLQKKNENYLAHYGVKGMKWGIRRYQDESGRLTRAGKERLNKNRRVKKTIEEYVKAGKAKVDELSDYQVGELTTMTTSTGEKYVSGLINGHDFDWREVTTDPYGEVEGFHSVAELLAKGNDAWNMHNSEHDAGRLTERDISGCNPGYGQPGTTYNCAKCSASLELRLRGIDVSAGRQTYPSSVDAESLWFKGAERVDYDYESVESALRSYGNKTSGTISIRYPQGGGHAMHWTNDVDGVFQIQDGQNGRTFSSVDEMMTTYGGDKSKSLSTFRLDNCEPNYEMMSQDSVLRVRGGSVKNAFDDRIVDTW